MQISRTYSRCRFGAETLQAALGEFESAVEHAAERDSEPPSVDVVSRRIERGHDSWGFDTDEEFFASYREGFDHASLHVEGLTSDHEYIYDLYGKSTEMVVTIQAPTRAEIHGILDHFDRDKAKAALPAPPEPEPEPPTIFIGHGHNPLWRELKDHLHEQHGYDVRAYEIGARAGHVIRDILEEMLEESTFAVLIMTAEDEMVDGMRARQNVVHETGLFQGRLGFSRAVVLVEEGVELYSNLEGVHQIRFKAGNIRETYGDVLATLRREFS